MLALFLLAASRPGHADTSSTLAVTLDLIWSAPAITGTTDADAAGKGGGLVLSAGAVAPGGGIVFLGYRLNATPSAQGLLLDAGRIGPEGALSLEPPSARAWLPDWPGPTRRSLHLGLAIGPGDRLWLGGYSYRYTGIGNEVHCDASLATRDRDGRPIWERTYRVRSYLQIHGIVPDAAGGAIAVGRLDWRSAWLGRIAPDGRLLAERRFGNGSGAVAVPLRDGRFLLVGHTSQGEASTYRDDVAAWLLDEAGELQAPVRIREAVNRRSDFHHGRVIASAVADGAYVASSWRDEFHPRAVEVARIGPDGAALWRRELPDTVSPRRAGRSYSAICDPALATLAGGDALVACELDGQIRLYRLDRETGRLRAAWLPLPTCGGAYPDALFLLIGRDGAVFLAGSSPVTALPAACAWMGRLTVQAE